MNNTTTINSYVLLFTNNHTFALLEPCYILRPLGYYLFIVWILGTILNGAVFCMLIRDKKLRKSPTNILIGGLILADFVGAFLGTPLTAFSMMTCRLVFHLFCLSAMAFHFSHRWLFRHAGCTMQAIITFFSGCSNMYILCLISIDR